MVHFLLVYKVASQRRIDVFKNIILLVGLGALFGCNTSNPFAWNIEGTGPPPPLTATGGPTNPFDPAPPQLPQGEEAPEYTDTFTQANALKVDIMWVIDSSGSMGDNQQSIRNNAAAFTNRLTQANVDFRLIVVTTASADDSELRNRCGSIITSATAGQFANCAVVGTNGSGREEGAEAARRALDSTYPRGPWNPNATVNPLNPNFLREEADLHIIAVSDEEEQPDGDSPAQNSWRGRSGVTNDNITSLRNEMIADLADGGHAFDVNYAFFPLIANHATFFHALKAANGPKVRFHSIVHTNLDRSDDCHTRNSTDEVGQRYMALANLMGGSVTDICGDWSNTMDELGLQASGLEKCFVLKKVPTDRSSFVVRVNGTTLAFDAYSFQPFGNQICVNAIPPAGAIVSITYH
jgi:hypothetical protein